jgi:hypothetical protein
MGTPLKVGMTDGSSIEIKERDWTIEALSGTSVPRLGNQRLVIAHDGDGHRLVYLEVKIGDKSRATGEFVEGDLEHTLRNVVRWGLAFPSAIDLVEGCLEQLHQKA